MPTSGDRLTQPLTVLCSDADLAVDCARASGDFALALAPEVTEDFASSLSRVASAGSALGVLSDRELSSHELWALAEAADEAGVRVALAMLGTRGPRMGLACDLGLVAVSELRPMLSALALLSGGVQAPWTASPRRLPGIDRGRLRRALEPSSEGAASLTRDDGARLVLRRRGVRPLPVGEALDLAAALSALAAADDAQRAPMPSVQGVERERIVELIFGPPRALSDPSSKAALEPYDLPLPLEELCTSASRAASEAGRIGFPVRVSLASPDLRTWDHSDLTADGVTSASHVRDVFRQIMALAQTRRPDARLLGVTVSATQTDKALLDVRVRPAPGGHALLELSFADPHGAATGDRLETLLPLSSGQLERALGRLRGASLLLSRTSAQRRAELLALRDVLTRLGAFVHDHRDAIVCVRITPLAVLVTGELELREACVEVGDVFVRSLAEPARPTH
ncbi:MAG: hypothetical protein GXP55_02710 [Deltaproteobacteria bacterium]|nr:hypothetical protein [Deltaproteobacteria bacterium]